MTQQKSFLKDVYSVSDGQSMRRYYDDWADSYDAELTANDYRTPQRCAEALARHASDLRAPVLDFACGTGLSGVALHAAGFACIDGTDISPGMLERARETGAYRHLLPADPDQPLDLRDYGYGAIVACGAIGTGAAPAGCLDWAIDSLTSGGLFVVSLNDHTRQDPDFEGRLTRAVEAGKATMLEAEDGAHLPGLDLRARVCVLRRA